MSIPGCDISGWQPANVNFTGMVFVYVKSTQGTYKVNANHDAQVAQARAAGLVVGHYHFPAWGDPVAEARAFVSANGARPGEFLVLDIEDSPQTSWPANPVPWCCAFVDEVHRLTGLWCMDYCGPNVRHSWDWTALAQRGGGLISPEYNNIGPSNPAPWAATAMWQNANTNISGGDSDIFFGDRNALLAYGTPGGVALDGTIITPITEDFLMALTDDEQRRLLAAADRINGTIPDRRDPNGAPYTVLLSDDGGTITTMLGQVFSKADGAWQNNTLPALVLNQPFTLPDGTKTNLAGVLAQLDAKPALTTAPASVDVNALAAKLTATLPPALVSALAAKLSQP